MRQGVSDRNEWPDAAPSGVWAGYAARSIIEGTGLSTTSGYFQTASAFPITYAPLNFPEFLTAFMEITGTQGLTGE